ncbi:prolactin-releasing peptide receptor-like [Acanthaster planci]|uniref:Prolactin-releasing peptide receptor-like n=1 Tax=Acanthaster planci TaxID=133434 RepID=A0A8B7YQL6_ACAPL|nr:prolactin-releasing peptide receptor-like [Acanthaster planci]
MADQNLALQIYQSIVGIVGTCGNGLACLVIARVRFMHTLTNAFIFNQALIDLLGSFVVVVDSLVPVPDPLPRGTIGVLVCRLWLSGYFKWALFVSSTFNLEALTLERYLAIVFPFRYQVLGTRKNATIVLLAVWLSAFVFVSYNIAMQYVEAGQCKMTLLPNQQVLVVALVIVLYLLPVIVMFFVYAHITVVLKRGAGRIQPGPTAAGPSTVSVPESQGASLMRARRNTFKTLLLVSLAFIVCWTPNSIISILLTFGTPIDFTSVVYILSVAMVATNCCVNPFVYAFKYKQFRKALKELLGRNYPTSDGSSVAVLRVRTDI